MNSYIWLSLETRKEVEITKEGLVIHHHPDMCPNTAAPAWEKQTRPDGNWPAVQAQKGAPDFWALCFLFFFSPPKKNNCSHSCIVKEQRGEGGGEGGEALEWQLGQGGTWLISAIIQTLSAPHIPLHLPLRCLSHGSNFSSRSRLT